MLHRTVQRGAVVAAVLFTLILSGCGGGVQTDEASTKKGLLEEQKPKPVQPSKVGDMANDVAAGVGSVRKVVASGSSGPLFIFEEFHTSKVGRLQTAVMLLRLHDRYGLRKIGLEGGIFSEGRLDGSWFQGMGGSGGAADREDLSVRWVAEGEISPPEFMTLAFKDADTYGVESAEEYAKKPDGRQGKSLTEYLLAIAERSISDDEKIAVNDLLEKGDEKGALERLLKADPWVGKQYESLKTQTDTSSEEEAERLREIQKKARDLGVEISAASRAGLQRDLEFYEAASKRSETMVKHVLEVPGVGTGVPTAILVGAAHTEKMEQVLTSRGIAFAVIRAADFNPKRGSLSGEQFERKSEGRWAGDSPGRLGKVLNARNPPPVITRATGRSYASMNMAGMLLAHAARGGGEGGGGDKFPDNVWPLLAGLPELRVDRASITRDGYDVTYRAWLKQDNGSEKEVWGLVGTLSSQQAVKTLEQKLLQAADDLKLEPGNGGAMLPPGELPPGSSLADGEGPRDGKRKGVVIARTGRDTLAVYAAKRGDLGGVGKLSD
jgi:hypothetical protein